MKKLIRIAAGLIVAQLAGLAMAQTSASADSGTGPRIQWQLSPYTYHFHEDSEHKDVLLLGLEREFADGKLDGLVFFSNSFGQPSAYLYPWGSVYHGIGGIKALSFKWTAGLLYGYVGEFKDKVPFNHNGFSPAAIIALAYEFKPGWSAQIDLLGNNAMMFQLNLPFN